MLDEKTNTTSHLLDDIEQISAAASHELRDQLREAMRYCEELRRISGADGAPLLSHIEHCIESTMENVGALRLYAYLAQNTEPVQAVSLDDILIRAKAKFQGTLLLNKGGIEWNEQAMPVLRARSKQLELLFTHLFDNGLKYNRSAAPMVRVELRDTGNFLEVMVEDNGIGMEPEYAFLVFGLFKRIDPMGPVKGCGAGLAIARKIAMNHDGTLSLSTEPGYGCRFTLTLPK